MAAKYESCEKSSVKWLVKHPSFFWIPINWVKFSRTGIDKEEDKEEDDFLEYENPELEVKHEPLTEDFIVERGQWGNKLDFLFSCISVSVGLGNVWRFPYLCYKNGGGIDEGRISLQKIHFKLYLLGAFLLVYFIAMVFCGVPIFFQEVAIGQYLGSGGMTLVAQLCPILKGYLETILTLILFLYLAPTKNKTH